MRNSRYYQKCITFGRAAEGLRADFQKQLIEMQQEIGFEYVRFHGLFHDDMAVYREKDGKTELWFGYIDKLFDFLLENGLRPLLELGFVPTELATVPDTVFWWHANGCPPTDYEKWRYLVKGTVEHLTQRYGLDEVKTWYFEVWNEPNLGSFWRGTQEEYFRLYEVSVDAVKSVCKEYRVGGPSTSGADFRHGLTYLKEFITFCEEKQLPVDFFTAHPYPTYWPLDVDGNEQMGYMKKEICTEFIDHMKQIVDASCYAGAELHLTEWNSSPSPRDLIHDTPFEAPFVLYNITQNFGKIASLGYWAFTDIFEENGPGCEEFHGGFGLFTNNGIKKPSYWAYYFLSKLGDELVEVKDNHVLTKMGENYQLIVWNYCHYTDEFAKGDRSKLHLTNRDEVFQNKEEEVEVTLPLSGAYDVTEYVLDETTSALHNWVKLGAPEYLTKEELQTVKNVSQPKVQTRVTEENTVKVALKPHEVRMYLYNKCEK